MDGSDRALQMVYGPRDYQHRLLPLRRMDDKRPAILLDEGVAHWCWSQGHIENVATAIALAITDERSTGRIYNFGEAEIPSMGEWLRKIGQAAGWNGEVVVVPKGRLPNLGRVSAVKRRC